MSISVTLMNNASPVEKIGKSLSEIGNYSCVLKENTSILKPVIRIVTSDNILTCNYMYISDLSRYYFIDDIVSEKNNIWNISGHVDVLETYKNDILGNNVIIENTENTGKNMYLYDNNVFRVNCKHKTDIINFPSGLLDTGTFILITAGG